jgi:hypothetical protein
LTWKPGANPNRNAVDSGLPNVFSGLWRKCRVSVQAPIAEPDCSAEAFVAERRDWMQALAAACYPVDVLPSWINIASQDCPADDDGIPLKTV